MAHLFSALFALSANLTASPAALPHVDRCSDLIGSCEYYSCVEEERLSCGDHGYPIGYGVKYCEKLSALEFDPVHSGLKGDVFPGDGTGWRDNVRECLQVEMDQYFANTQDISCESLRTFAFDSHPRCYTQNQPISFCTLAPEDVLKVGFTIAPEDLLTAESLRQVRDTAEICEAQLDARLAAESKPLLRLELQKYRLIWKSIARNPALALLGGKE